MENEPNWPPTLYEWAGGSEALKDLTKRFYEKVLSDSVLQPVFGDMAPNHPEHVAKFLGEVLGGPAEYSALGGGHAQMVRAHFNRNLTQEQRGRWVQLLIETADEIALPDDPEFRSAFLAYIEWGTRIALMMSQPGAEAPPDDSPMPKWGWGVPGGPFRSNS